MIYDTVTERHQCTRCTPYVRAGEQCSVLFRRSPVSLVISLCWFKLTSQCIVCHVFYTSAVRNDFSVHRLPNIHFVVLSTSKSHFNQRPEQHER